MQDVRGRVISNLRLVAIIRLVQMIFVMVALASFGVALVDWRAALVASLVASGVAVGALIAGILYLVFIRLVFKELYEESPIFSLPYTGTLIYFVALGLLMGSVILSIVSALAWSAVAGLLSLILGILGGLIALVGYIFVDVIGYFRLSDHFGVDEFRTAAILNIVFPLISPFFIFQAVGKISVASRRERGRPIRRERREPEAEWEPYRRPHVVEETVAMQWPPRGGVTETVPRGALVLPNGRCVEVTQRVEVGRDLLTGLVPDFSVRYVSRRHFAVYYQAGDWYVEDLGSRNGTYLNGKLLQPNVPQRLRDGDVISPAGALDIRFSASPMSGCIRPTT